MISRRRFFATACAAILAAPLAAETQQSGRAYRIGVLSGNSRDEDRCLDSLRRGLGELGYVEGKTHVLDVRWSKGRIDQWPRLTSDLLQRPVDLIVSFTPEAHPAVKQATSTILIVMASSVYPVETGIIASLARPGGNITGVAGITDQVMAKRLELLREAVPAAGRVAVIRLPGRIQDLHEQVLEEAAKQLGIQLHFIEVRRSEDLAEVFQAAVDRGARAVMTTQGPFFALNRAQIAELALRHKLPSLPGEAGAAKEGTLLSYGPNILDRCHRAAAYVDKLLKGAKPGDLPVEQPTKFELVINLRTAKALGLTFPQSLLVRADEVIQ